MKGNKENTVLLPTMGEVFANPLSSRKEGLKVPVMQTRFKIPPPPPLPPTPNSYESNGISKINKRTTRADSKISKDGSSATNLGLVGSTKKKRPKTPVKKVVPPPTPPKNESTPNTTGWMDYIKNFGKSFEKKKIVKEVEPLTIEEELNADLIGYDDDDDDVPNPPLNQGSIQIVNPLSPGNIIKTTINNSTEEEPVKNPQINDNQGQSTSPKTSAFPFGWMNYVNNFCERLEKDKAANAAEILSTENTNKSTHIITNNSESSKNFQDAETQQIGLDNFEIPSSRPPVTPSKLSETSQKETQIVQNSQQEVKVVETSPKRLKVDSSTVATNNKVLKPKQIRNKSKPSATTPKLPPKPKVTKRSNITSFPSTIEDESLPSFRPKSLTHSSENQKLDVVVKNVSNLNLKRKANAEPDALKAAAVPCTNESDDEIEIIGEKPADPNFIYVDCSRRPTKSTLSQQNQFRKIKKATRRVKDTSLVENQSKEEINFFESEQVNWKILDVRSMALQEDEPSSFIDAVDPLAITDSDSKLIDLTLTSDIELDAGCISRESDTKLEIKADEGIKEESNKMKHILLENIIDNADKEKEVFSLEINAESDSDDGDDRLCEACGFVLQDGETLDDHICGECLCNQCGLLFLSKIALTDHLPTCTITISISQNSQVLDEPVPLSPPRFSLMSLITNTQKEPEPEKNKVTNDDTNSNLVQIPQQKSRVQRKSVKDVVASPSVKVTSPPLAVKIQILREVIAAKKSLKKLPVRNRKLPQRSLEKSSSSESSSSNEETVEEKELEPEKKKAKLMIPKSKSELEKIVMNLSDDETRGNKSSSDSETSESEIEENDNQTEEVKVVGRKSKPDLFVCEVCNKKFKVELQFAEHLIGHARISSHDCDRCETSFSRPHELHRHIINNHRDIHEPKIRRTRNSVTTAVAVF